MKTSEFALLVRGQRTGRGRWKARCPAHVDRSPSLSIAEGEDGRTLIRCFAGCTVDSILSALQLQRKDLFAGPPPTPGQVAALRAEQDRQDRAAQERRHQRLAAITQAERLESLVNSIGAKLARNPESSEWKRLFEKSLSLRRKAVEVVESFYPSRRESAQEQDKQSAATIL